MFQPPLQKIQGDSLMRHFTPNWFTVTMGTGILSLMLAAFPYPFSGQQLFARSLWQADTLLFILFSLLFAGRLLRHRDSIAPLLAHPVQSMFLGAIPMGLVPIIDGMLRFGPASMLPLAHGLWWLDAGLAAFCGLLVPYQMFTRQRHALEGMTAVWLLPIVAAEVTASCGGLLAPHLDAAAARTVIGCSYLLWSLSVPLAMGILVILFLRLACHSLPPRAMAVSAWLSLGPIGTGALALLLLGKAAPDAFAGTPLAGAALFADHFGLIAGGLLWGYGIWWWVMAWLITLRYMREGLPFNMGWWGFTFPVGVFAAATLELAQQTGSGMLTAFAALLILQLAFFWLLVARHTLPGMWHGHLFHAPCLQQERKTEAPA